MNSQVIAAAALPSAGQREDALVPIVRKITKRLVPLLMACYVVAYLDRINVGYAQLQMRQTLPFDMLTYSIGAGIFFLGYFLFEVPSNLLLARFGFRKTMVRIMLLWGAAAIGMAFVRTPTQFYVTRFLLGLFEAGFLPGVILYFTYWFPSRNRGQVIALFMSANAIGSVVAGPVCGAILKYVNGFGGLHGWQWLFILEGLPACILAVVTYLKLPDGPAQAPWLEPHEKKAIAAELRAEDLSSPAAAHTNAWRLITERKVYGLSLVYALHLAAMYTMVFTGPGLLKRWGISDLFFLGIIASLPHTCAVVAAVLLGRSSDRRHERRWHYTIAAGAAALGIALIVASDDRFIASLIGLTIATMGWVSAMPVIFATTTEHLPRVSSAAGIALVSSLGNIGAAFGPPFAGWLTARTGQPWAGMYFVIVCWLLSAVVFVVTLTNRRRVTVARR